MKLDTEIMTSYQEELAKKFKKQQEDAEAAYAKLDKGAEIEGLNDDLDKII